jgi:uncharacterized membrane protein
MFDSSHLHPMLVHFPIALVIFGFLAELAALFLKKEAWLSKAGFYLLVLGTLSALAAWFTGIFFTSPMSDSAGEIKATHALFAWLTLGSLIAASAFSILLQSRKKEDSNLKWIAFALYALAAVFVSITGFYGGTLVYNYMMPL